LKNNFKNHDHVLAQLLSRYGPADHRGDSLRIQTPGEGELRQALSVVGSNLTQFYDGVEIDFVPILLIVNIALFGLLNLFPSIGGFPFSYFPERNSAGGAEFFV
jgi:hypothetical protein